MKPKIFPLLHIHKIHLTLTFVKRYTQIVQNYYQQSCSHCADHCGTGFIICELRVLTPTYI